MCQVLVSRSRQGPLLSRGLQSVGEIGRAQVINHTDQIENSLRCRALKKRCVALMELIGPIK